MKKECRFWKKGQKDQRPSNTNQNSSNTNEGETTVVAIDGDVFFTVSVEDACVYTSISSFDGILDSGASHHVIPCKDSFVSYNPGDYGRVHLGTNHFCSIVGVGDVHIKMKDGQDILLKQVRHVSEMRMSLISMGRLNDEGNLISFGKGGWKISKGACQRTQDRNIIHIENTVRKIRFSCCHKRRKFSRSVA